MVYDERRRIIKLLFDRLCLKPDLKCIPSNGVISISLQGNEVSVTEFLVYGNGGSHDFTMPLGLVMVLLRQFGLLDFRHLSGLFLAEIESWQELVKVVAGKMCCLNDDGTVTVWYRSKALNISFLKGVLRFDGFIPMVSTGVSDISGLIYCVLDMLDCLFIAVKIDHRLFGSIQTKSRLLHCKPRGGLDVFILISLRFGFKNSALRFELDFQSFPLPFQV